MKRSRFVLVEPDTLSLRTLRTIFETTGRRMQPGILAALQARAAARYMLCGVRFRRGPLEVAPNPGGVCSASRATLYYEIYGLKKDAFDQTRYRVTAGLKPAGQRAAVPAPMRAAQQPEVTLSFEQMGDQTWERAYLEVDLGKIRPGRNRLTVTVQDLNAHSRASKETFFYYRHGAASPGKRPAPQ